MTSAIQLNQPVHFVAIIMLSLASYRAAWLALAHIPLVVIVLVGCEEENGQCRTGGVECVHGLCELRVTNDGTEVELCICHQHYSGPRCQFSNVICSRVSCKQGSFCDVDGCVCSDPEKQTGDDCSEVHCTNGEGQVLDSYCKNGGVCHNGDCVCPNHTSGARCELANCGDHFCSAGYCQLDRCVCDVACVLGCDQTRGSCKVEADSLSSDAGLSTTTKIILIVVVVVVCVVILPSLYAMYNMRLEHQMRNERLKSHYEMEKRYQEAYLSKNATQPSTSKTPKTDEVKNDAIAILLTDAMSGAEAKSTMEVDDEVEKRSKRVKHTRSKVSKKIFVENEKVGKSKRKLKEPRASGTTTGSAAQRATGSSPDGKKGSQASDKKDKSSKRKSGKKHKK